MEIKTATFVISNTSYERCPADGLPEFAFIGRSNVGKSSLINMLANHDGLAKTSSKPGKTLLINHFLVNKKWYIVDLPGYGYAKIPPREREKLHKMITDYVEKRETLYNLFVLVDSRIEPQQIDIDFMDFLGEGGIPFSIVFTKSDGLSNAQLQRNLEAYRTRLLESWEELPPIFVTSSEKRQGREELLSYIDTILKS